MLYLIALLCPPLAVLCAGRFLGSIFNLLLCVAAVFTLPFGVVFAVLALVHAWTTVTKSKRRAMPVIYINNSR